MSKKIFSERLEKGYREKKHPFSTSEPGLQKDSQRTQGFVELYAQTLRGT